MTDGRLRAPVVPTALRAGRGMRTVRVLVCSLLMAALVAVCLVVHHSAILFYRERLADAGLKGLAFVLEQAGYALPLIVLAVFPSIVYRGYDRRDGDARWEMFWEVLLVAVLTYAVLLPCVARYSDILQARAVAAGVELEMTAGKVPLTLLMQVSEWFVRFLIPVGILLVFHGTRASRERHFPETEVPEPVIYVNKVAQPDGNDAPHENNVTNENDIPDEGNIPDGDDIPDEGNIPDGDDPTPSIENTEEAPV